MIIETFLGEPFALDRHRCSGLFGVSNQSLLVLEVAPITGLNSADSAILLHVIDVPLRLIVHAELGGVKVVGRVDDIRVHGGSEV